MLRITSSTTAILTLASVLLAATPALATYGAIAWDKESGKRGWSWDAPTPQKAAAKARSECGASGCMLVVKPTTACAALATTADGKFAGAAARKTKEEARLAALAFLSERSSAGDCVIRVAECNK